MIKLTIIHLFICFIHHNGNESVSLLEEALNEFVSFLYLIGWLLLLENGLRVVLSFFLPLYIFIPFCISTFRFDSWECAHTFGNFYPFIIVRLVVDCWFAQRTTPFSNCPFNIHTFTFNTSLKTLWSFYNPIAIDVLKNTLTIGKNNLKKMLAWNSGFFLIMARTTKSIFRFMTLSLKRRKVWLVSICLVWGLVFNPFLYIINSLKILNHS